MKKDIKPIKVSLGSFVLPFEDVFEIGNKKVEQITMRQPVVRDMKLVEHHSTQYEQTVNLIANLTALSVDEIESLPTNVYARLQEGLESFL